MLRPFQLSITDLDGEDHSYWFRAETPWDVTDYVRREMKETGDFYGHEINQSMDIRIHQLVDGLREEWIVLTPAT